MAYIKIRNLEKTYRVTRTDTQNVLRGIDAEFEHGEFVAVLGESGCGKSTLLNILGGLDSDYSGSVELNGTELSNFTASQMDDYRKKEAGIIFQSYNLIGHMTVAENIEIALSMSDIPPERRKARAGELIARVKMSGHAKKYPYQLSGGQKQRVAIARALANNPTVILADEPTGNLDKIAADEILEILKEIAKSGKIVICVTHSERVAQECTRIIRIDDGKIVSDIKNPHYYTVRINEEATVRPQSIKTKELWAIAYKNVKQSKKRTSLVILALAIGIAAVVMVFSIGQGLRGYVETEVASSMNRLQIDVMKDANGVGTFDGGDINLLNNLGGTGTLIQSSAVLLGAEYKTQGADGYSPLLTLGATFTGFSANLKRGNLPQSDNDILISSAMAVRLNGGDAGTVGLVIGKAIEVEIENTDIFTVCGIVDDSSNFDTAYITLNALNGLHYSGQAAVNKIYILAKDVTWIKALTGDLNLLGYYAYRQDSAVEELLSYIDIGTATLAAVAAISLIVSAIMTFIVMYISVIERTKEIGILRSIGARKKDVRRIFMFEALIIGLISGTGGGFAAWFIGFVVNMIMKTSLISLNPLYALSGVLVSAALCAVSGLGPAGQAADADPIEALRTE